MPGKDRGLFGFGHAPSEEEKKKTAKEKQKKAAAKKARRKIREAFPGLPRVISRPSQEGPSSERLEQLRNAFKSAVDKEKALDRQQKPLWDSIPYPARKDHTTVLDILTNSFPTTSPFRTIQAEAYNAFSQPLRRKQLYEVESRYTGALFQDFNVFLLKLNHKNDSRLTILSGERVQDLFKAIYPDKEETHHFFSTLGSLRGITVPDGLIVEDIGPIERPQYKIVSELQISTTENRKHFINALSALGRRRREAIRSHGLLRGIYDARCDLLSFVYKDADLSFMQPASHNIATPVFPNMPLYREDFSQFVTSSRQQVGA